MEKQEVIDPADQVIDEATVAGRWAKREVGLLIATLLRYNDEHNKQADLLSNGVDKSETTAPILERLGYTLTSFGVIAAAHAIKKCVNVDGQNPQIVFTSQILDLRALEREGLESWRRLISTGFPLENDPCPCGSRDSFASCCKAQWVLEETESLQGQKQRVLVKKAKRKNGKKVKVRRRRKAWKCDI